jgi:hypothetical protein
MRRKTHEKFIYLLVPDANRKDDEANSRRARVANELWIFFPSESLFVVAEFFPK